MCMQKLANKYIINNLVIIKWFEVIGYQERVAGSILAQVEKLSSETKIQDASSNAGEDNEKLL